MRSRTVPQSRSSVVYRITDRRNSLRGDRRAPGGRISIDGRPCIGDDAVARYVTARRNVALTSLSP